MTKCKRFIKKKKHQQKTITTSAIHTPALVFALKECGGVKKKTTCEHKNIHLSGTNILTPNKIFI